MSNDPACLDAEPLVTPYDGMVRVRKHLSDRETALLYVGWWLGKADDRDAHGDLSNQRRALRYAVDESMGVCPEVTAEVRWVVRKIGVDLSGVEL